VRPVGRRSQARLRLCAAVLAPFLLSACAPQPFTEQGQKVYTLYNIVLTIAVVVGAGVIGMILLSCVRYRKLPGDDTLPPQTHGNTTFEIIWTAVPTIIVLALFAMSFTTIRAIDTPSKSYAAVIEVRGYQWSWTFDYGTNAAGTRVLVKTANNEDPPVMMVPVGQPVHVEERSDNVIHSFMVPRFLFKRDVVPGKANGFDFTVTAPGTYHGQCAELCGTEHAKMTFKVKAVGRAEFDDWFQKFVPPAPKCEETGKASSEVVIHSKPNAAEFVETCVYVTAGAPAKIEFVNGGGLDHNVQVNPGAVEAGQKPVAAGKIIKSGSDVIPVPALEKGKDYTFYCVVHPLMQGKYVVQ
jgi:cytochrome c oxidase subunit 2